MAEMNGDDEYDDIYGGEQGGPMHAFEESQQRPIEQQLPPPGPPPGPPRAQEEEDDFQITLAGTDPRQADEDNDDEFEVLLDDPNTSSSPGVGPSAAAAAVAAAGPQAGFRYSHMGGEQQPRAGARPYMDAASAASQAQGSWAGGGRGGPPGLGRGLGGTRPWRPQFVPLGTTSIDRDDTLAFPESAQPGQMIKLPGQTRVTSEEYSEFTMLGNGGIFDLDMDRVVDAPWKVPGIEISDFFNYGITPAKWRAYVREIQQAHAESQMQEKIRLYEPVVGTLRDPEMPSELAVALAAKGWGTSQTGSGGPAPPSAPTPQGNMPRQEAPDAILVLAGHV